MKMAKCISMIAMVLATMALASGSWAQSSGTGDSGSSSSSGGGGHHHHHQKSGSTSQESK
jgi:hypothetical protein